MIPEGKEYEGRRLLRLFALVYGPIALLVIGIFLFVIYEQAHIERANENSNIPKGAPVAPEHPSSLLHNGQ